MTSRLAALVLLLGVAQAAEAHVGSPDVYVEGNAGAYRMLVVVRMPQVIPGVAEVEVRVLSPGVRTVRVTPMRIRGFGSDLAPVADVAEPLRSMLWKTPSMPAHARHAKSRTPWSS